MGLIGGPNHGSFGRPGRAPARRRARPAGPPQRQQLAGGCGRPLGRGAVDVALELGQRRLQGGRRTRRRRWRPASRCRRSRPGGRSGGRSSSPSAGVSRRQSALGPAGDSASSSAPSAVRSASTRAPRPPCPSLARRREESSPHACFVGRGANFAGRAAGSSRRQAGSSAAAGCWARPAGPTASPASCGRARGARSRPRRPRRARARRAAPARPGCTGGRASSVTPASRLPTTRCDDRGDDHARRGQTDRHDGQRRQPEHDRRGDRDGDDQRDRGARAPGPPRARRRGRPAARGGRPDVVAQSPHSRHIPCVARDSRSRSGVLTDMPVPSREGAHDLAGHSRKGRRFARPAPHPAPAVRIRRTCAATAAGRCRMTTRQRTPRPGRHDGRAPPRARWPAPSSARPSAVLAISGVRWATRSFISDSM